MKYFYTLACLYLTLPFFSTAQDLLADNNSVIKNYGAGPGKEVHHVSTGERPATETGSKQWEKEEDRVNGHISHSNLTKMKSRTDALISFLQDSCMAESPYNPVWHGEYFSEKTGFGPLMKFGVQCRFYKDAADLTIMANDISPLLDHIVVNNKDLLTLTAPAGMKNNCPYFETALSGTDNEKPLLSRVWLITTGDQLPYSIVSRKEYLQEARTELNDSRNRLIAEMKNKMPVRSAAIQESEKKAALDQLNLSYSGMDLQVRMKMFQNSYRTDEAYLKENTDKATAGLDSTLHLMDHLLIHLSAQELAKPAIVSVAAADFQGFEDNLADRKMLIRMNPAYFNPYLSTEKPQFFLVCWNFVPSDPTAAGIDRQLRENFDGDKIKEMLGK